MMLNTGESPNVEKESHLSWILETNPDPKYNLSPKACQGILRRAKNRGKKLPELLEKVLIQQSAFKNEPEKMGGAKESLSSPTGQEPCQPQTIKPYCIGGGQVHDAMNPEEICKTLNCMSDPMKIVCYGMSAYESNAMKSANPNSGIYEADTSRTLDNNGGNPACNQGGMIVLEGQRKSPIAQGRWL